MYYGWRDSCDGCMFTPTKWGSSGVSCTSGGNTTDNSCTMPTLGGQVVSLYGLNTDGDVNDDDKFYVGLYCEDAPTGGGTAIGECPAGEFVTGIQADGTLECGSFATVRKPASATIVMSTPAGETAAAHAQACRLGGAGPRRTSVKMAQG